MNLTFNYITQYRDDRYIMNSRIILLTSKHIMCYKMWFWKLHECGHTNCLLMIFLPAVHYLF